MTAELQQVGTSHIVGNVRRGSESSGLNWYKARMSYVERIASCENEPESGNCKLGRMSRGRRIANAMNELCGTELQVL
jgi:hypothetical protein